MINKTFGSREVLLKWLKDNGLEDRFDLNTIKNFNSTNTKAELIFVTSNGNEMILYQYIWGSEFFGTDPSEGTELWHIVTIR